MPRCSSLLDPELTAVLTGIFGNKEKADVIKGVGR
jgi:hypothetical protein